MKIHEDIYERHGVSSTKKKSGGDVQVYRLFGVMGDK